MVTRVLLDVAVALVASWVLLALALLVMQRRTDRSVTEVYRMVPLTLRLVASLVRDPALPAGVRLRLVAALVYAGQPINLIPDWIPVIGFSDNIVVVAWALRSAARRAGPDAIVRHWRGSPATLDALFRLLRLPLPVVDRAA